MKKILFLLLLLPLSGLAQLEVGTRFGLLTNNTDGLCPRCDQMVEEHTLWNGGADSYFYSSKMGFDLAVMGIYTVPAMPVLALQGEVAYSNRGLRASTNGDPTFNLTTSSLNWQYFEVPMMLRLQLPRAGFQPYVLVGGYGSYLLGIRARDNIFGLGVNSQRVPIDSDAADGMTDNRADAGLRGGVGLSYRTGRMNFFTDCRYSFGLLQFAEYHSPLVHGVNNHRTFTWALGMAFTVGDEIEFPKNKRDTDSIIN